MPLNRASQAALQPVRGATGTGPVRLDLIPNPFRSDEIVTIYGPEGCTIADLLEAGGVRWRRYGGGLCWIEDEVRTHEPVPIDRRLWHRVRPKAGTVTTVKLMPGRGGGGGKSILATVLALAVAVVAFVAAPALAELAAPLLGIAKGTTAFTALAGVIAAGINIIGNLAISALIGPPTSRTPAERAAALDDAQGFTIQGTSNRAKPYQKIPLHLGRLRRWPDLAAEFVVELRGDDQYLRFLMIVGWGPLQMEEWKIGETPIEEFEGVRLNAREGWPDDPPPEIYTADFHTEGLSVEITKAAGWQTRETLAGTDEIQIEIQLPEGLFTFDVSQQNPPMLQRSVELAVEIAPAGTDDWASPTWLNASETGFGTPGKITISDRSRQQVRRVGRILPDNSGNESKQWRVRVRRISPDVDPSNTHVADRTFWSALKSVRFTSPMPLLGKVAWVEGEIKASGQLNGTLQELNCIATSYVRTFDGSGFVGDWETATGESHDSWETSRNPAELFAHVATHPYALPKKIADTRLDFAGLADWRDDAAQIWTHGKPRFWFDRVYESPSTLGRVLDDIAAVGRARRGMPGGRHGVVRDVPQDTPKQHYTPRNSANYRCEIAFRPRLHGVRVRYNKDGLGQEAEITVYDDGYSADGSVPGTVAATRLETTDAIGMTDADQVWCLFRYHLAVARLRPHVHSWTAGVEVLKAGRGSLVRLTHDVPGFGLEAGRILAAATNDEGEFTGVALDTPVTMEPGKSYGIRVRNHEGSFYTTVVNPAEDAPVTTTTVTFSAAQPSSWAINATIDEETGEHEEDLFGFGEADRESAEMLITAVVPGPDLGARLIAVDAAPGVHDADLGEIPAFDPQITLPPADARKPETPVLRTIRSDESVLVQRVGGALAVRFLAEFDPPRGLPVPTHIQARWRLSDSSPWTPGSLQPAAGLSYSGEGVQQGLEYTIEFRYVTDTGRASDWLRRTHVIIGKTTPPPDVPALFHAGSHIVWPYADPPLDVQHGGGFRVRYHYGTTADWSNAIPAHDDLVADPRFPVALLPPGELTIMVKAVDADGNESDTAARLFTEIPERDVENILVDYDYVAAGFPGFWTGCAIDPEDDRLASEGQDAFWEPGDAPFWEPGDEDFWADEYAELDYRFRFAAPPDTLPAQLTFAWATEGAPVRFEWWARNDATEKFWGDDGKTFYADDGEEFWGAGQWLPWPGTIDLSAYGEHDFRLRVGGGDSRGRITTLTARLDVPDVEERLYNVAIEPGGTAIPVTKTFRMFVYVIPVLRDDGGDARGVRVVSDLPSAETPVIECLDADGASCAGHVDILPVHGY